MCFPTLWEFSPHTLGVLPLFFCFNVGIVYICSKSIVYEKETTYYQE